MEIVVWCRASIASGTWKQGHQLPNGEQVGAQVSWSHVELNVHHLLESTSLGSSTCISFRFSTRNFVAVSSTQMDHREAKPDNDKERRLLRVRHFVCVTVWRLSCRGGDFWQLPGETPSILTAPLADVCRCEFL